MTNGTWNCEISLLLSHPWHMSFMIKGKGILENISYKPWQGSAGDKMLLCFTQTDTLVLRDAEKKRRESKIELELHGDTNHECDSYLSVPPPYGTEQTHTHTNTKIFKKQSITSKGHHGDYQPVTQRCRNLMHVFLGRSHKFPSREEMELDEILPKR